LLTEGVQIDGVILEWHTGSTVSTTRLAVGFQPPGGERIEFSQNITDYVQAPPENWRERLDRDVIPLSLLEGETIPVRYDADKPSHAVIDEPELHRRAIEAHRQGQADLRRTAEEKLERQGSGRPAHGFEPSHEQPAESEHDTIQQLAQLGDLYASGALTYEEFTAEKHKLLGD
jgi:hypothetical protein